MEGPHANEELARSRGNRLRGSSRAFRLMEQECRRERRSQDEHETQMDLLALSFRGEKTISYVLEPLYHNYRDREMESLRRQIKEFEYKIRGRRQRRNYEESSHEHRSTSRRTRGSSHQSHSSLSKDKSNESTDCRLES